MRFLLVGLVACKGDCPQWYADEDGDGFGQGEPLEACDPKDAPGRVRDASDCDDHDATIHPDAVELCDASQTDEDCDGLSDDEDTSRTGGTDTWADADGDGFGDPGSEALSFCVVPAGRVENTGDCDDAQARAFPGAAWQDSDTECLADLDSDGYGAAPGTDCDDASSSAYPGAHELFGDGIDQDCDTLDPWQIHDDFETGAPDPGVWTGLAGPPLVEDLGDGLALRLDTENPLRTVTLDTSGCQNLVWSYGGLSFDEPGPQLQFHDGTDWVTLHQWVSLPDQYDITSREGVLTAPEAYHASLSLRFFSEESLFFLDEFRLACTGPDADGDHVGERDDCDESSPSHWSDCGQCVDADADGYGRRCDLGPDCDDTSAAAFPGNPDLAADGLDDDCNGYDGPSIYDDFEDLEPVPAVWESVTAVTYTGRDPHGGQWAVELSTDSELVSLPFDASSCDNLWWSYWAKRESWPPALGEALVLSWDDGTDWVPLDTLQGTGASDGAMLRRQGVFSDPAALWSGFRVRLHAETNYADFVVDDLVIACSGPDEDGDTFPSDRDCDDTSAVHWKDCGVCQDTDGDGYGLDCDLGDDCDDTSADRHPLAADVYGDALDGNCDGFDGVAFFDDFELGYLSPDRWDLTFEVDFGSWQAYSGDFACQFDQEDRATTQPFDTSSCPAVFWRFQGRRETPPPDEDEYLQLSWFDGASWVTEWRWFGTGEDDNRFFEYSGLIEDLSALRSDFRLGFETNDIATSKFLVDDLLVVCTELDTDLDGHLGAFDCDNADAAHWSDCGICEDPDGDDRGPGCDLGDDCAPSDAAIFPGAPDAFDGIDTDCSGLDGPDFTEDFEDGTFDTSQWVEVEGDVQFAQDVSQHLVLFNTTLLASTPKDLSGCSSWSWSYEVRREWVFWEGDALILEWWDGAGWAEADRVVSGDSMEEFEVRAGTLTESSALASNFRFRFRSEAEAFAIFDLDNVVTTCTPL